MADLKFGDTEYPVSEQLWYDMSKDAALKAHVEKFAQAHGMKVVKEAKAVKAERKVVSKPEPEKAADAVPTTES